MPEWWTMRAAAGRGHSARPNLAYRTRWLSLAEQIPAGSQNSLAQSCRADPGHFWIALKENFSERLEREPGRERALRKSDVPHPCKQQLRRLAVGAKHLSVRLPHLLEHRCRNRVETWLRRLLHLLRPLTGLPFPGVAQATPWHRATRTPGAASKRASVACCSTACIRLASSKRPGGPKPTTGCCAKGRALPERLSVSNRQTSRHRPR